MKTLLKTYMLTLICVAFTACSSSDEKDDGIGDQDMSITFSSTETGATRAQELQKFFDNFLVCATKTMTDDSKQDVMPKYVVKHNGTRWYYDGINSQELKYWDYSAASYTFSAVSPAPTGTADYGFDATVGFDANGKLSITNAKGNVCYSTTTGKCADWMIARTIRTKATMTDRDDIDPSKKLHGTTNNLSAFHEEVPLNFHHIFARVDFAAYCEDGELGLKSFKAELDDESDKITNRGDYTETDHWTNLQEKDGVGESSLTAIADEEYDEGECTISDDKDNPIVLASHIQIPQEFPSGGRKILVTLVTENDEIYTGTITLNEENNDTNSWLENRHYTYILKIKITESDNVILFAVNMDEWLWLEGNDKEDKETNW